MWTAVYARSTVRRCAARAAPRAVRLFQECPGEVRGVLRVRARVGEDVERARRLEADAEADTPQAVDHHSPPLGEDRAKAPGLLTGLAERRDPGPLDEVVRRDEEVPEGFLHRT